MDHKTFFSTRRGVLRTQSSIYDKAFFYKKSSIAHVRLRSKYASARSEKSLVRFYSFWFYHCINLSEENMLSQKTYTKNKKVIRPFISLMSQCLCSLWDPSVVSLKKKCWWQSAITMEEKSSLLTRYVSNISLFCFPLYIT